MGWKQRREVLIANLAKDLYYQEPASVASLLSLINSAPRTNEELEKFWEESGYAGKRLRKTISDLMDNGACQLSGADHAKRGAAGDLPGDDICDTLCEPPGRHQLKCFIAYSPLAL